MYSFGSHSLTYAFFKDNIIRLLGLRFLGIPALGTNNWVSGLTVLAIFLGLGLKFWNFWLLGFVLLGFPCLNFYDHSQGRLVFMDQEFFSSGC